MDPVDILLLAAISLLTGILDSTLGGGGLILIPTLVILGLPIKSAIGTSRVTFVMDSFAGLIGHLRAGNVQLKAALPLFTVLVAGSLTGTLLTHMSPPDYLRKVFGGFMVLMALALFTKSSEKEGGMGRKTLILGSFGIGTLIGMFGAGLGTVTILFLAMAGFPVLTAVGTSQAMVFVANTMALSGYFSLGYVDMWVGLLTGGFAATGALIGVRVAVVAGEERLKALLFLVVLLMAAILLLGQ
jgi:uncharacterized membrane protein YfcA